MLVTVMRGCARDRSRVMPQCSGVHKPQSACGFAKRVQIVGSYSRLIQSAHIVGARRTFQQLLRIAQVALFVEEGADMLRQFREEFHRDRFLIRAAHLVGCRNFGRFGVHHFLSLYKVDYQSRLWLRASVACALGTFRGSVVALTEHQSRDFSVSQLISRYFSLCRYCRYWMLRCGKYFATCSNSALRAKRITTHGANRRIKRIHETDNGKISQWLTDLLLFKKVLVSMCPQAHISIQTNVRKSDNSETSIKRRESVFFSDKPCRVLKALL
jgi:hypothetical protein